MEWLVSHPAPASGRRRGRWRIVRLVSGWTLIALGIVGLVLPILQGVALIVAGLALLAPDMPWARRSLDWLRARLRRLSGSGKSDERSIDP